MSYSDQTGAGPDIPPGAPFVVSQKDRAMTGPYQPQQPGNDGWGGGDPNSPFGASDPNSPFAPQPAAPDGTGAGAPSSSEGMQYRFDSPAQPQPPVSGPPPVHNPAPPLSGPPPGYPPQPGYPQQQPVFVPQQPPRRSNTGVIVGSVIGVMVVLALVVGVLVVVNTGDESSDGDHATGNHDTGDDGSTTDTDDTDLAVGSTHTAVDDPCQDIDYSPLESIKPLSPDPSGATNKMSSYTMQSCYGSMGSILDDEYAFYSLYAYYYDDLAKVDAMYETWEYVLDGCEVSEISGAWEEGVLGTGHSDTCSFGLAGEMTYLILRDGNLYLTISLDTTTGLESGAVDAVTKTAENVLSATAQ